MRNLKQLLTTDWGQVCIGKKNYSVRLLVTVAGAALWLGSMLVETGTAGVVALWTNLLLAIVLVIICSATRTMTVRQLVALFFIGGFMMGIAMLLIDVIALIMGPAFAAPWADGKPATIARAFLVPVIEESFKIAPVLFLLWRWRSSRLWTLAATDVLLMAAACGAGFAVVEDAYIRHQYGPETRMDWLPTVIVGGGRMVAGHAIWTTLAGAAVGLGLLLRSRRRIALAIGASGFALSTFTHIATNYGVDRQDALDSFMNAIAAHGYLVLYVLFVGTITAIAADLYIQYATLPPLPELKLPSSISDIRMKWVFAVQKRALAHAVFHYQHSGGVNRAKAISTAALLDAWFHNLRSVYEPVAGPSVPSSAS